MADLSSFSLKYLDRQPSVTASFTDSLGYVNLSGASVQFIYKNRFNMESGNPVTGAATIDSAASGLCSYTWSTGDASILGEYVAEWRITYVNGFRQTIPNDNYISFSIENSLI